MLWLLEMCCCCQKVCVWPNTGVAVSFSYSFRVMFSSAKADIMHSGLPVSQSFCEQHYYKSNEPISLKLGVTMEPYQAEALINFWWWSDSRSLFNFPRRCGIGYFRRFIGIFSYSHWPIFRTRGDIMNPQHFGSDPADIWIWINPYLNPGSLLIEVRCLGRGLYSLVYFVNWRNLLVLCEVSVVASDTNLSLGDTLWLVVADWLVIVWSIIARYFLATYGTM